MTDLFGIKVSLAARSLGVSLPVAATVAFALGAYQGCHTRSEVVAARNATLMWSRGHVVLCVPSGDAQVALPTIGQDVATQCNNGIPIFRRLNLAPNLEHIWCDHRGFWIWGLCHAYDLGRKLREPVPFLDVKNPALVRHLWHLVFIEVLTRCGDDFDIIKHELLYKRLHLYADQRSGSMKSGAVPLRLIVTGHLTHIAFCEDDDSMSFCIEDIIALQDLAIGIRAYDPKAAESIGIGHRVFACPSLAMPDG